MTVAKVCWIQLQSCWIPKGKLRLGSRTDSLDDKTREKSVLLISNFNLGQADKSTTEYYAFLCFALPAGFKDVSLELLKIAICCACSSGT